MRWGGEDCIGYAEWSTPIQHKYVQTVIGPGREAHTFLSNLTIVPQPQNMSCGMALLFNPYMTLEWVAVPCNQPMPNVLNVCEENNSSVFQDTNRSGIGSMSNACPMYFLSSNNSCFTVFYMQECTVCKQRITLTSFHDQPQLLTIWGLSMRNETLFIQDRGRVVMLVPKFQYWLKNMSLSYHRMDVSKWITFDIIPLTQGNLYLFQTGLVTIDTCSAPMHFACEFESCILTKFVCDGVPHCPEGIDEIACQTDGLTYANHYSNRRYYCNSGEDITVLKACDFHVDCQDGSDETLCVHPACMWGKFQCNDGQCIDLQEKCDLKNDCLDGTDEKDCKPEMMNAFKCGSGNFIPVNQVHDLWPDCANFEDENGTLTELNDWHSISDPIPSICTRPNLLPCMLGTSVCYPAWAACLLDHDEFGVLRFCRNGGHLSNCTEMQCIGTFKCPGSYCLPLHKVCDSQNDCAGGADEMNCEGRVCPAGTLACDNSTICVHQHQLCDNIRHCPAADDEEYCVEDKCPDRCTCKPGIVDCVSVQQFPTFSVYVRAASIDGTAGNILPDVEINGPYLLYLIIANIYIKLIDQRLFAGIPNIRKLFLSTGTVTVLPNSFSKVTFLKILSLRGNPISKIEPGGLRGMAELVSLDLSHTLITRLESNIFDGLLSLQQLIVTNTPLDFIADDVLQHLVSLELLDIRETMVFVSKPTIALLSKLPSRTVISSHSSVLCMIAAALSHSCKQTQHKPNGQLVPYLPTIILLFIISLVAMACTIISLGWHGRLLSMSYSLIVFNLTLSNVGTLTHSLIISVRFLYPDIWKGSLLAVFHWGQAWQCYLAMAMGEIALVQSPLFFSLLSMKRCLAAVRPLHFHRLSSRRLKSAILWVWILSGAIPCLILGINLSTQVSQQSLSRTRVFCILFTHVQEYWLITFIVNVLYTVMFICTTVVMLTSAVFIIHVKRKTEQSLRKSKHTTKKQLLVLMAKLCLESGSVLMIFVSTVLGFVSHVDMDVGSLQFVATEVAIFAGIFRSILVCVFHTFLASDFKTSVSACMKGPNNGT